jgi:hypothetical protein
MVFKDGTPKAQVQFLFFIAATYLPLVLSWTFGLAAIAVSAKTLSGRMSLGRQTLALAALVLFTPFFGIGTLGMEHTLHVLLTLLFLYDLEDDTSPTWRIAVVTALMVGTRYEGLFLAGPAFLLLLLRPGRRMAGAAVAAASVLPVALYSWMSLSHHGYWLPNSVALKGLSTQGMTTASRINAAFIAMVVNAIRGYYLSFLLAGTAALALAIRRPHRRRSETLGLLVIAGVTHLVFADLGWAYRYEAYLIAAATVCVIPRSAIPTSASIRSPRRSSCCPSPVSPIAL